MVLEPGSGVVKMAVGVKSNKRLFTRRGPPETRRWRARLSRMSLSIFVGVRGRGDEGAWC